MRLVDARWALPVNRLTVVCDCGVTLDRPSNISLVQCPLCRRAELWHSVDPVVPGRMWSEPVMRNEGR
jgi:hypothetical protein